MLKQIKQRLAIVLTLLLLAGIGFAQPTSNPFTQENENIIATLLSFKGDQSKALAFLDERKESVMPLLCQRIMAEAEKTINTSNVSAAFYLYSVAKYVAEQVNDRPLQARALYKLGWIYTSKKDYPKAIDFLTQSQQMYEQLISENNSDAIEYKRLLSKVFYFSGRVFFAQDNLRAATFYYERSMKLCEETVSTAELLYNLYDLGSIYIRTGNRKKATEVSLKTLDLSQELENSKEPPKWVAQIKANAIANLGKLSNIEGDYKTALEHLQRALDLSRNLDDSLPTKNEAIAARLADIGDIQLAISEWSEALNYYTQAMAIARDLDNKTQHLRLLTSISTLYRDQGDNRKADKFMEDSEQLVTKVSDKREIIRTLVNIGISSQSHGKYDNAGKNFQQALRIAEASGDADLMLRAQVWVITNLRIRFRMRKKSSLNFDYRVKY